MHSLTKSKAAEVEVNVSSTEILQAEKSLTIAKAIKIIGLSFAAADMSACLLFVSMFGCWLPSAVPFCFREFYFIVDF